MEVKPIVAQKFKLLPSAERELVLELKESYYDLAKSNLTACIESKRQLVMLYPVRRSLFEHLIIINFKINIMNTIMEELKYFKKSKLGLYDSSTGKTVVASKVVNLITARDFKGQAVVKYAKVKRGLIAQICQWYEKGKDLGMTLHYHINEMTAESLANDVVFETHAKMIGYKPIDLAVIIYENAPKSRMTVPSDEVR